MRLRIALCWIVFVISIITCLMSCCTHCNDTNNTNKTRQTIAIETDANKPSKNITKIVTYDKSTSLDTCISCQETIKQNGWKLIKINEGEDFFDAITLQDNLKISKLVMVSHSIRGKFNTYFNLSDICTFAAKLKPLMDSSSCVYLNGCNTAIESTAYNEYCFFSSTAQRLSNLLGENIEVYGSKGYLSGTYAEGNTRTTSCNNGAECYGVEATGDDVWHRCISTTDNCRCIRVANKNLTDRLSKMIKDNQFTNATIDKIIRPFADFKLYAKINQSEVIFDVYLLENIIYNTNAKSSYSNNEKEFSEFISLMLEESKEK